MEIVAATGGDYFTIARMTPIERRILSEKLVEKAKAMNPNTKQQQLIPGEISKEPNMPQNRIEPR